MQTIIQYRYQLDGSNRERKQKINCPYCGAKRSFTRYKDYETGEYLSDEVGQCDRANKCGQHVKPKEWFSLHPDKKPEFPNERQVAISQPAPIVHLNADVLKGTLNNYENNSFIKALSRRFEPRKIEAAISNYYIGTISAGFRIESDRHLPCLFWYIDQNRNIRAGQVKLFNEDCSTEKYINSEGERKPYQTWIHSLIQKQYSKDQNQQPQWLKDYTAGEKITCLFGEHLLSKYPNRTVCLVEAPKTAIIASIVYPQYVWIATSSLTYLTKERCKVLKGRRVILFPDCGIPNPNTGKTCLQVWRERINEFQDIADFKFSTLLEDRASQTDKEAGFDLADLLLREARKQSLELTTNDILSIPVDVRTGQDFGNMILATVWMRDGKQYDILFDKAGELITSHEKLQDLSQFFNKTFLPATIDSKECLINIANN